MTSFQTQLFSELSSGHSGGEISSPVRVYFEQRFRNRMYQFILDKFLSEEKNGLTKAKLARRIGKTPDIINRWLGSPSNLTADTMCDLLLGIAGEEFETPRSSSPFSPIRSNYSHFDDLRSSDFQPPPLPPTTSPLVSAPLRGNGDIQKSENVMESLS
jgi:hypothetical protein